jgi:Pyruvate/2-oxoacid:ferredoxin oxidoreductase gamma subunit
MERELVMTGIGGQGIQLATQVLARAAIAEGREVQLFGSYEGLMRGGATEATLAIADGPIESPPTVAHTWSAILMHHEHSAPARARLIPGSLVLVNSTVFAEAFDRSPYTVLDVPATDAAIDIGNILTASMVMLGAYAAVTGIVSIESLTEAVAGALPSYRAKHVDVNVAALRNGFDRAPRDIAPAWVHAPSSAVEAS